MLVDNSKQFRANLKRFLRIDPDLEVIAEAQGGEEACALADEHKPDLVLMDLKMGAMDGIEATRRIKNANPQTQIIVLTVYDEDLYRSDAAAAGAADYILKEEIPDNLLRSIKSILSIKD